MADVLGELFGDIADAIRSKTGEAGTMKPADFPNKISSITAGGGGSSEDVCYVTFMSEDGTVEYGKKAVAVGDDCADPIARGIFETPTKESTEQHNYTFAGWATEPNGGLDSNALNSVTENRTVYANFAELVRYYTISFYDSDGITLLTEKSVAYGSIPSYTPSKDGYYFVEWTPELAPVTEDASYTAVWIEKPKFATATWAKIIETAQSGNAASSFNLGDERTETITYADGSSEEITWIVVGFDKYASDYKTNTVSMIIAAKHALSTKMPIYKSAMAGSYESSDLASYLNGDFFDALPEDLQDGIKDVYTSSAAYATQKVFIPSLVNIGLAEAYTETALAYYDSAEKRIMTLGAGGEAVEYWARTWLNQGTYSYYKYVTTMGKAISSNGQLPNSYMGVVPMFCIK